MLPFRGTTFNALIFVYFKAWHVLEYISFAEVQNHNLICRFKKEKMCHTLGTMLFFLMDCYIC